MASFKKEGTWDFGQQGSSRKEIVERRRTGDERFGGQDSQGGNEIVQSGKGEFCRTNRDEEKSPAGEGREQREITLGKNRKRVQRVRSREGEEWRWRRS